MSFGRNQGDDSILIGNRDDSGREVIEVKVYPRAYIEDVTGIDAERRTVTAKFVLFITIEVPENLY